MPPEANELLNRRVSFATHVFPALGYAGVVFYAGLIRLGALPEVVGFVASDKLLHALVFGGLALLLARTLHWLRPTSTLAGKLWGGCAGSSMLGLLLELCQAFTSYRSSDPWDWVADTIGALLAIGVASLVCAWIPRRAHG